MSPKSTRAMMGSPQPAHEGRRRPRRHVRVGILVGLLCGVLAPALWGDAVNHVLSPRRPLAAATELCPLEGPQRDVGSIVVIEHDGSDYAWKLADGTPNYEPRTCVARRFYQSHSDAYDFVVVFTNFEFETGQAAAFYNLVRNDVRGIGQVVADNGAAFGSPGRLKGYVDMAALSRWVPASGRFEPGDPAFAAALDVLSHEVGHQWLSQVRYRDASGQPSADLLGQDGSHWSYLLDSDASFLYGSDWVSLGAGRYRAERVREAYSALDLYLMGLLPAERTPPFTLLRSPGADPTALPREGAEVEASPEAVSVAAVVAVEGARDPDARFSQKEFRLGFVMLVQPGTQPTPQELEAVDRLRDAFQAFFFAQTRGVAVADTTLAEAPPPPPLPDVDLERALGWLLAHQALDGRWEDLPGAGERDSSLALMALDQLGQTGQAYERGRAWLGATQPRNTDFIARRILALAGRLAEADRAALAQALLQCRSSEGGFGPAPGYAATALDTALALRAMRALGQPPGTWTATSFERLAALEAPGGGWGVTSGGSVSTLVTAEVLQALLDWPEVPAAQALLPRALSALTARRNPDGGFGESPSTAYATALALGALSRAGLPLAQLAPPAAWLKAAQLSDGSWNGSRYETALALGALKMALGANLTVPADSLVLDPPAPREGETVHVTVVVKNAGRSAAGATHARVYEGPPATGDLIAEVPVAALGPGEQATVELDFTTAGRAGAWTLYVMADARGEVEEAREDDNAASRAITVAGLMPDLEVALGAIQVTPDPPAEGETAQVAVTVRNRGERATYWGAFLRLVLGDPRQGGRMIGDAPIPPIDPGNARAVAFTWDTTGAAGQQVLYAVADATYAIRESDESNNETAVAVEVSSTPPPGAELELNAFGAQPAALSTLPQTVELTIVVKNLGLSGVASSVAVYETDPPSGPPLFELPFSLGPREGTTLTQQITLATPGTRHLLAMADPSGTIPEPNENNNRRGAVVLDPQDTVDLELLPGDVVLSSAELTIGDPLTVTATVRNHGTAPVTGVPVVLTRTPGDGGAELARALVDVGPVSSAIAVLRWTTSVTGSPLGLLVRVDPFGVFPEASEANNDVPVGLTVHPSSRPNLRVSGADVTITPEPPLQGESAVIAARVANPSVVAAGAFRVAVYRGDPASGGTLIGDGAVPGLTAGGDATVQVTWSPVDVQGVAGLYVVADADAQVDEYDETDNVAFRPLSVVGFPDLVLGSGDVGISPAFPHGGEAVVVQAVVRSQGQRPAGATVLRVYEGEVLVAELPVPALSPGESVTLQASWNPTGLGERALSLVVDPEGAVAEADEGNNTVRRAVVVQDADVYLTALYFSPDGDGAHDETTLAWRAPEAVSVVVSDGRGRRVRTLVEQGASQGSVVWDGRDDRGGLLFDGDYTFTLTGSGGRVLGRAVAALDTNRLPIHEAAGTGRISVTNLTCMLPNLSGPAWMPSEDEVLFIRRDSGVADFPPGLLRVGLDGSYAYLFQDPWYLGAQFAEGSPVSPDGREVLVVKGVGAGSLYAIDLLTGVRRPFTNADHYAQVAWSPDGQLVAVRNQIVSREGQVVAVLSSELGDYLGRPWAWSPDGELLAKGNTIVRADGSDPRTIELPEALEIQAVLDTAWRGDGRIYTLVSNCGPRLHLRTNGDACSTFAFLIDPESGTATQLPWLADHGSVDWSPSGDRVLYYTDTWPQVTEVAAEDGSQALRLLDRVAHVSPRKSMAHYWNSAQPGSACYGSGNQDLMTARSLDNLTADFQVSRLAGGSGLLLTGVAADRHLESWQLEYAQAAAPDVWLPIGPASSVPVLNDALTAWVPPAPGTYALRLVVRDRAGSARSLTRVVAWDRLPSITNLTQTEFLISPANGDGVKDVARFDYLVQEPTRLDVAIAGPQVPGATPPVVRTFSFDYPSLGARFFAWDGRDASGQLVADGRYEVLLNSVPLRVDVDNTPPDIGYRHENVRSERRVGYKFSACLSSSENPNTPIWRGKIAVDRLWHVVDKHLKSWTKDRHSQGTALIYEPERDASGQIVYENGVPVIRRENGQVVDRREVVDWPGAPWWGASVFEAEDHAGNKTVLSLPSDPERLFLLEVQPWRCGTEPDRLPPIEDRLYRITPKPEFILGDTVAGERPGLTFQYQPVAGGAWSSVVAVRDEDGPQGGWAPDLLARGVPAAKALRGRFVRGDLVSEAFQFRICDEFLEMVFPPVPELPPPPGMVRHNVAVYADIREPVASAVLEIEGQGSLKGYVQVVHLERRPNFGEIQVWGKEGIVVPPTSCACPQSAQLLYNMKVRGASGRYYEPDACARLTMLIPEQCPFQLQIEPIETTGCGSPNSLPLAVSWRASAPADLVLERGPDVPPVIFDQRQVEGEYGAYIDADVTGVPEGNVVIGGRLRPQGSECQWGTETVLYVDRTPPDAAILEPVEGASACVSDDASGRSILTVVVSARDRHESVEVVGAEYRLGEGPWKAFSPLCLGVSCSTEDGHLVVTNDLPAPLGWDVTFLEDGDYTVRFTFCDRRGNRSQVERHISLNRQAPYVRVLDVTRPVFSPNGDGRADATTLRIRLAEALSLTAEVRTGTASGPLVRTLLSQQSLPAGDHAVTWDGMTVSGTAPDGTYAVVFRARNACGHEGGVSRSVEVDTTPPVVQIAAPQTGTTVSGSADVRGVASDPNLATYDLSASTPDVPWTFVATGTTSQGIPGSPTYLARWLVPAGEGAASLRLMAVDKAENEAQVTSDVTRVVPTRLERSGATPPLFSPNGDGRRETAALEYRLLVTSRVTLEVRDVGGALVRRLVAGDVQEAGSHAYAWDGRRDDGTEAPDAEHAVVVTAEAPEGGGAETAQAAVIVDRTPPDVVVERPVAGAYLDHEMSVRGSIQDVRLSSFVVTATPSGGAPIELARGNHNQPLSDLAALSSLTDGPYALAVDAEDQAENRRHVGVDFVVDSIAPAVAIHEPAPGSVLLKGATPVAPNGVVTDANLREWVLEAGPGANPAYFVEVRRQAIGGFGIPLGPWAVSSLPDGPATLRLTAEDRAGHTAETRTTVDLDGTPPVAALAQPAEGQCVNTPRPIMGTATDAHVEAWDLEAAPGPAATAYQWTSVAQGTSAVSNGALAEWNPLPPDGVHTLRLTVRDKVGLVATALRTVSVDTTAPGAPSGLVARIVRTGAPVADVVLTWTPSANAAGYRVTRDGQALGGLLAAATYTDAARPEGVYAYRVVAEDACGNAGEPVDLTVTVDLTPPMVDILRPVEGASVSGTVDVRGTAWSAQDFKEYRLSVGAGEVPTSWTLLRRQTLPVLAGPLGTWTALGSGPYTIALEAEDLAGNVARALRHVTLDNLPPQAPVLTSVEVSQQPSWLLETWQESPDTDVAGYLLYRDGRLANATGIVIGDLRPYLVPPPTYLDKNLPDGERCYRVVAMDEAGNLSLPSNQLCRTLDNRPPHAEIVQPASGTRFEFPIRVTAYTPDTDVVRVQFQRKAHAEPTWLDLGAADTQTPWETTFDPQGLALGEYDLRAVATDGGSRTDPAPTSITVIYGDTTAPPVPLGLAARADEDRVHLAWTASTAPDLAGYHVYRDGVRITGSLVTQPSFDELREPGTYAYAVTAQDQDGNESQKSAAQSVLVYQVRLDQPFPVTLAQTADLSGGGTRAGLTVDVRRDATVVASSAATGETFQVPGVGLVPNANILTAQARDAQGDRSIASDDVVLISNAAPAALQGLAASVNDHDVTLSWDASPEADVFGYALRRDGVVLTPTVAQQDADAIWASSWLGTNYPARAFDGNPSTAWFPVASEGPEHAWMIQFPSTVLVERVEIAFVNGSTQASAVDSYRIEALWEGRDLPLVQVRGNTQTAVQHAWPWPFATDTLRVVIVGDPDVLQGLAEVRVFKQDLVLATTYVDPAVPDGYRDYEAAAVDRYGAYGSFSPLRVAVGDVTPPGRPTGLTCTPDGSDAVLLWNPNPEPDVHHYALTRDGASAGTTPTPAYRDAGLPNGTYRYAVMAVDAAGNASDASDPADCTLAVAPPVAPVLRAVALSSGAIGLDWDHPGAPQYVLYRSAVSGGPYTEILRTSVRQATDTTAPYGVPQFYVVRAKDANLSPASNEATATAQRTDPMAPPVILFPADAAHPATLEAQQAAVRGQSEPGSRVTLRRADGTIVGDATAQAAFTPQGRTALPGGYSPAVSPDGRYAALASPTGTELRWLDLATGAEATFTDPAYEEVYLLDFAGNARRLLYRAERYSPSYQVDLLWLDIETGTTHPVETGAERTRDARWSADGGRIAFTTTTNDADCPVRIFDLGTGTTTTLFAEAGCVYGPVWSPDGTRVAFRHYVGSTMDIKVQAVAGGAAVALGETWANDADWSPDGTTLAYTASQPTPSRVRLFDVATGVKTDLTDGTRGSDEPHFDPTGRWLSFGEEYEETPNVWRTAIVGVERATGARRTLASGAAGHGPRLMAWTRGGYAAVAAEGQLSFLPGFDGAFEVPAVPLEPGENVLLARAQDPRSGLTSPDSAPVRLTVPEALFPDLVVRSGEIGAYPSVPLVGQPAALRALVRNTGGVAAPGVDVHLTLSDASGAPVQDVRLALAALPVGGSTLVSVPWTPALAGAYRLDVAVDESQAIVEVSEDNNAASRSLTVVETGLVVTVGSDRPAYPAHTAATASVRIVNGSGPFEGTARTTVTDATGHEVAVLDARAVSLAYGQQAAYSVPWNTGTTYAGPYAFNVEVVDVQGQPAGTAEDAFAILPDVNVTAALRAAAASVPFGTPASFHGRIDNRGVNAPQAGLVARFGVLPEGGTTPIYEAAPDALPLLLPNASWERGFVWPVAAPQGRYVARLRVTDAAGTLLAEGSAAFEVGLPPTAVSGTIAAEPDHVLRGTPFEARFAVTNAGAQALPAYPVVVEVLQGSQGTLVTSQATTVDLGPGATHQGAFGFESTALTPGPYVVRLLGGAPPATLARAILTVHGPITPPSIDQPPDGATVTTSHPLLVVNNGASGEGAALTYELQVFTDSALQMPISAVTGILETPQRTSWRVALSLPDDHVYYWRARASDGFQVSAWSAVASFRVDAQNGRPAAPVPDTPAPGATVTTRQPSLVVRNAMDPDDDVLTYELRLAQDADMAVIVASATGVPEGAGLTSWGVPVLLDENTAYWWSARASDGHGFSPWSAPISFLVDTQNEAPGAPVPLRPVGGAHVAAILPELVVGNATDPEGAGLAYRFELDVVPSFDSAQRQASPLVPEGSSTTDWVAPLPLRDDTRYHWRAAATDGAAFGPWATASFFVNLANDPPGRPVLLDPVGGRAVPTATPSLLVRNAVDPEGDVLTYDFEVSDGSGTAASATGVPPGAVETSWTVAPGLQEDQVYSWRARARDAELPGPWSAPETFRVNAVPAPPTAPGLIAPAEGQTVAARRPALVVSNATSPDNQTLTYAFELYSVGAGGDLTLVDQTTGVPEGASATTWTAGVDLTDGAHSWRARAQDAYQWGPWMPSAHFTVAVDMPPAPPTGLAATPGDARVSLAWNPSPEPDVVAYRVYRGLVSGGPYAAVADVTATSLVDTAVTNGTTYYYVVTALDAQFESGTSSEAAATPQGSTGLTAEVRYAPDTIPGECLLGCGCSGGAAEAATAVHPPQAAVHVNENTRADTETPRSNPVFVAELRRPDSGSGGAVGEGEDEEFPSRYSNEDRGVTANSPVHVHGRPDDDSGGTSGQEHGEACPEWLKATIELPAGYDPATIAVSSVRLEGSVPADPTYSRLVDSDGDGVAELEVRFAFDAVAPFLAVGTNHLGLSGTAGGVPFAGEGTVTVPSPAVGLRMSPRTLKQTSNGQEVLARLSLRGCGDGKDIDPASLRLNETVPIERVVSWPGRHDLIVKFDRAAVIAVLPVGDHVEVRVSGVVKGLAFVAVDYIRVIP